MMDSGIRSNTILKGSEVCGYSKLVIQKKRLTIYIRIFFFSMLLTVFEYPVCRNTAGSSGFCVLEMHTICACHWRT